MGFRIGGLGFRVGGLGCFWEVWGLGVGVGGSGLQAMPLCRILRFGFLGFRFRVLAARGLRVLLFWDSGLKGVGCQGLYGFGLMSQGKLKTKHGAPRVIAGTLGICRDSKMCMGSLAGIMDGNDVDKHPHSFTRFRGLGFRV